MWDLPLAVQVWGHVEPGWTLAMSWLLSPAVWSQIGLLVVAWLLAVVAGRVVGMMARASIQEIFDGKWIVVPSEDFITIRAVNYSGAGRANRNEARFSVRDDTDINRRSDIINSAVAGLSCVLAAPDGPECELIGFSESGMDFAEEDLVKGIDDGARKDRGYVRYAIWNALTAHNIAIPFLHRVIEVRGQAPGLEPA